MFRYEFYDKILSNRDKILNEMAQIPEKIGLSKYKGKVGLAGGSGCPPLIPKAVSEEMERSARTLTKVADLDAKIRKIVKTYYGDDYDGAVVSTCEASLWTCFDVLVSPPFSGRGDLYRSKYLAPYERHIHHQAGYGRPFPPQYKDLSADRGCTAGELGVYAKRLSNVETVFVPLEGADYTCHGIKYHPCPLLLNVDPEKSYEKMKKAAEIHANYLSGITSMGYDTPGYGYKETDQDGAPILSKYYGELAREYNIPYICDNARGTPFIGTDIRKINADVMVYSTDKAFPGPTAGLIIGKEDKMVQIRRAIGIHGNRWGTGSSHGKAGYVGYDPGKEIIAGLLKVLELILETPELFTKVVDEMYEITLEEFEKINPEIKKGLTITKSYNSLCVEINYQNTWDNENPILPIFSIEDMYSGTNLVQAAFGRMGVNPPLGYDANIPIGPNLGTTDENGILLEEPTRLLIRSIVEVLEVLYKYSK